MSKVDRMSKCKSCLITNNVWLNDIIVDTYQKNGYNFYTYICSFCDEKNTFKIPIEKKG